jgi:hypothetical protein
MGHFSDSGAAGRILGLKRCSERHNGLERDLLRSKIQDPAGLQPGRVMNEGLPFLPSHLAEGCGLWITVAPSRGRWSSGTYDSPSHHSPPCPQEKDFRPTDAGVCFGGPTPR